MASADAAPSPDAKPTIRPCASVRRMHSTPIGPTGAAIEKPRTSPFHRNGISTAAFPFYSALLSVPTAYRFILINESTSLRNRNQIHDARGTRALHITRDACPTHHAGRVPDTV